jgi:PilZ domain
MRKARRIAVDEPARLHPNGWSSLEVRVLDCSESGFRAACDARVRIGFPVTLDIPGVGPTEAQVTWCRDGEFGARFTRPLDLPQTAFRPLGKPVALARLLVQRAGAHRAGVRRPDMREREQELRREILGALPIHRG